MKLQSISKIFIIIVAVLGGLFWFLMSSGIDKVMVDSGTEETKDLVAKPFENPELFSEAISQVNSIYALLLFVFVVIIIATVMSVVNGLTKNSGSLKSVFTGIGIFVAVLLISYLVSGGDPTPYKYQDRIATAGESQMAGAGLIAFYILIAVAAGSMLLFGIKKMFK